VVDKTDEWQEDCLPRGGFDNCRLANAGGVKVDVGSLFGRLSFNVEVEEFDDVADEVGQLSRTRMSIKSQL
jgi:hypothetical protein